MAGNEEVEVPTTALGPLWTLAVRITDGLRALPDIVDELDDRSVTEASRLGLEAWVDPIKSNLKVPKRAEMVWDEIDREGKFGQSAIEEPFQVLITQSNDGHVVLNGNARRHFPWAVARSLLWV